MHNSNTFQCPLLQLLRGKLRDIVTRLPAREQLLLKLRNSMFKSSVCCRLRLKLND
jgi:hypothetical protein